MNANWRKQLGKSNTARFGVPQLYNNADEESESRNWMESVEGGDTLGPTLSSTQDSKTQDKKTEALIESIKNRNPGMKDGVVLAIHQKFLRLQACYCFLWSALHFRWNFFLLHVCYTQGLHVCVVGNS